MTDRVAIMTTERPGRSRASTTRSERRGLAVKIEYASEHELGNVRIVDIKAGETFYLPMNNIPFLKTDRRQQSDQATCVRLSDGVLVDFLSRGYAIPFSATLVIHGDPPK